MGPRKWSRFEEFELYTLDDDTKAYLLTIAYPAALKALSRTFPAAPTVDIYDEVALCLRSVVEAALAKTNSSLNTLPAEHAILATALPIAMYMSAPSLAEVRAAKHADPLISPLFDYHANNRNEDLMGNSKYLREAPFTTIDNGVIYYRALIGTDDTLAHAVLLPITLVPQVLQALHDGADFGHPGEDVTYSIIRERYFWKHMRKSISNHIKECDPCLRSRTTIRQHE